MNVFEKIEQSAVVCDGIIWKVDGRPPIVERKINRATEKNEVFCLFSVTEISTLGPHEPQHIRLRTDAITAIVPWGFLPPESMN